jgi:hypothetical protein
LIDGDLSDWDRSGAAPVSLLNSIPLISDKRTPFRANFRIMADGDYVYLGIKASGGSAPLAGSSGGVDLVDVELYGGVSLASLQRQRYRGIDGLIRVSQSPGGETIVSGPVRLPLGGDPTWLADAAGLWSLLGARAAAKLTPDGFTAEIQIPVEQVGWRRGAVPPAPLQLNVRAYGVGPDGAPIGLQWIADPQNTAERSHEFLGGVTFDATLPGREGPAAPHVDPAISGALEAMVDGSPRQAANILESLANPRALPLLSIAFMRSQQHDRADEVLRKLAKSASTDVAGWANRQLVRIPRPPVPGPDFEQISEQARSSLDRGAWNEAIEAFGKIAADKSLPSGYRSRALLQIQTAQLGSGRVADSIATARKIQGEAADGDPSRRASFHQLIKAYYGNGAKLDRERAALFEGSASPLLSALMIASTQNRAGGMGCWQTIELGELQRVEALPADAVKSYIAAIGTSGCPRTDRAWALLLLQRAYSSLGRTAEAFAAATRIETGFADEWDICFSSLQSARSLPLDKRQADAMAAAAAKFASTLSATLASQTAGSKAELRKAASLLADFNRWRELEYGAYETPKEVQR